MIALYRGHIIAVFAVLAGIVAAVMTLMLIIGSVQADDMVWVIILASATWQVALILGPASYIFWVPEWEREEKITGRFPGDKEKE